MVISNSSTRPEKGENKTNQKGSRTESFRSTLTVCSDGTINLRTVFGYNKKEENDFIKFVLKLMKAVHHMTLYWNEYISFAIVSHYCLLCFCQLLSRRHLQKPLQFFKLENF